MVFNHDFIIYIDFSHIAASHAASDDVTNYMWVTHRVYNTDLLYSHSHFVVKICGKIQP